MENRGRVGVREGCVGKREAGYSRAGSVAWDCGIYYCLWMENQTSMYKISFWDLIHQDAAHSLVPI